MVVVTVILSHGQHCRADEPAREMLLPGFTRTEFFNEQIQWRRLENGVRVHINCPQVLKCARRRLVIYATPNGSSIEQTLGCAPSAGLHWHFGIQHVAAQIRQFREYETSFDTILAVVQAPKLSWPGMVRENQKLPAELRKLVLELARDIDADDIVMAGHSGGGSFLLAFIAADGEIPNIVSRLVFLDANYSYSDDAGHGDKLLKWLEQGTEHRLLVVAYDDREIQLNGKRVVGPDGGTFRASDRMLARFRKDVRLTDGIHGQFRHVTGLNSKLQFFIHPNPENEILHTRLVGEMSGLLRGLSLETKVDEHFGTFGEQPTYLQWIQSTPSLELSCHAATIPSDAPVVQLKCVARASDADTGTTFCRKLADSSREEREALTAKELIAGNFPDALRTLVPIRIQAMSPDGQTHTATFYVTNDDLAIGSAEDSVRMPMSPQTAIQVADVFDATLLTTRMSDLVYCAATARLDPRPLTDKREAVETFLLHHKLIETQLQLYPRKQLIAGIKKDVVISNRLKEKPHRVAIYGWHKQDGIPIQPLYAGHVDWYVDYSHGIRLVSNRMFVDDAAMSVADVLKDPQLHVLLSNEGPLDVATLRKLAEW